MNPEPLSPELLGEFRKLSTCVVASAIETFDVRLRNTGFANSSVRSIFPDLPPLVGYAATARILTADPPMEGHSYYARPDWWEYIRTIPEPRVVVIQDTDYQPGLGAFLGEEHPARSRMRWSRNQRRRTRSSCRSCHRIPNVCGERFGVPWLRPRF
jgi:4-hydroxy-4-methyl-2-oxoglutarate aldolase